MGLYSRYVLPKLIHAACGLKPMARQRQKVVPHAHGRVLEVGIGSGLNLPYYDASKVEKVWGLDPDPAMNRMAGEAADEVPFEVEILGLPGDQVPLDTASIDTVVMTYTLCTIPESGPALEQIRRVLKPGGELLFCEHGEAPDESVRKWQGRINPLWKRLAGGCHLNRAIPKLLEEGGFKVGNLETMYLPGWRPASFNYWGSAVPR